MPLTLRRASHVRASIHLSHLSFHDAGGALDRRRIVRDVRLGMSQEGVCARVACERPVSCQEAAPLEAGSR